MPEMEWNSLAHGRYIPRLEWNALVHGRYIPEPEWNAPAQGVFHAALGMYLPAPAPMMTMQRTLILREVLVSMYL